MRRIIFFIAFFIIGICNIQCTDDEEVEASVYAVDAFVSESGEEGDQDLDDQRD